jgi:hypothetical protein
VTVSADQLVWVNAAYPDEWIVQFSRRKYDEPQAKAQIAALGLPHAPGDESRMFWRFVVVADAQRADQLKKRFGDPSLHAGVVRRQVSYSAKWDQIGVDGDALLIKAADPTFPPRYRVAGSQLEPVRDPVIRLSRDWLLYLTVGSQFVVPHDALVVVTSDEPGSYWHYLALYLLLLAFIGINAAALLSPFRRPKGPGGEDYSFSPSSSAK